MDRSIVEYFAREEADGSKCGYCKQEDTRYSNGMWAHSLTVQDYQDLIDRGWRRSGQYCYKPINNRCCCPMYTIRCEATNFKMTKSQKKVLKKFRNFVESGERGYNNQAKSSTHHNFKATARDAERVDKAEESVKLQHFPQNLKSSKKNVDKNGVASNNHNNKAISLESLPSSSNMDVDEIPKNNPPEHDSRKLANNCDKKDTSDQIVEKDTMDVSAGNETKVMKRKLFRRERWRQRQIAKGLSGELQKNRGNKAKTLEERLKYTIRDGGHKFSTRIVPADIKHEVFQQTFQESLLVYQKYQEAIHGDPISKCNTDQFKRFLCKNPLIQNGIYGAFHRHYLLDEKIIAVGVIDILPSCISSVYLYYDPDFSFLTLGTYTSLSEIHLVRSLQRRQPALQFYYLGFYIHSCPKMRYKGEFSPSFLACSETYTWQPIEACRPLLDVNTYARFCPNLETKDPNAFKTINDVLVLHKHQMMDWCTYVFVSEEDEEGDREQEVQDVTQYAQLVGKQISSRMLLYRK